MNGALVISLDFELLWGVFDKVDWTKKVEYFNNTRKVIPEILQLFEKYEISCTWATVGMLFNKNWEEWNMNIPENLPAYTNEKLSAYHYGKSIQSKETEKLCFAPELIKQIAETSRQEIGTHTYSHYYCLEPGQDNVSFRCDLNKALEMAADLKLNLKSLVFPRNQYNSDYLKACEESGINTIRTNPLNWYWQNTQKDSLSQKIFRTGDAYFGLQDKAYKNTHLSNFSPNMTGQKASRLLRPYSGKNYLDRLKLRRIFTEMEHAAKNNKIYHLWWHPHNFGENPEKNLEELKQILGHYKKLKEQYNFQSLNMRELAIKSSI
jgi:peptidoglycan/xylan/chitin deacetylase (PgdA/CDA1 family)